MKEKKLKDEQIAQLIENPIETPPPPPVEDEGILPKPRPR